MRRWKDAPAPEKAREDSAHAAPASPAVEAGDAMVRIRLTMAATIRGQQYKADDDLTVDAHVADSLVNHFHVAVRVGADG